MTAGELLTTLGRCKQWLDIPSDNTDADDFLNVLIGAASGFVLNYTNRCTIALTEHSEIYDGFGNSFMVLRQDPVIDVTGVSFNGTPIPASQGDGFTQPFSNGWAWTGRRLQLYGYAFPRQRGAIGVKYTTGYVVEGEQYVVPSTPFQVTTLRKWLSNVEVYLGALKLTLVDTNPQDGEYTVSDEGVYTFNSAQAAESVSISYSYAPADIEQAVWEMVGERYKYRDRIGQNSKSLGGQETVSFARDAMSQYVRQMLQPYVRVIPA